MIAALKFVHILGLVSWSAALLALPLLIQAYQRHQSPQDYAQMRLLTHLGYIGFATPAALITIIAGTGLIFAASVFTPWLLLKLVLVAGMVLLHVWLGHIIQISGEERKSPSAKVAMMALILALPLILGVFIIVLLKPDFTWLLDWIPAQFLAPRSAALSVLSGSEGAL